MSSAKGRAGTVLLVAGGLALVVLVGWSVIQLVPRAVMAFLPTSLDRQLGETAAEQILADATECTNPAVLEALKSTLGPLEAALPEDQRPVRVHVLDDEAVNAFALPGGHVFVFRGLLKEARSADEVAGVLAHEIGHAVLRHGMKRMSRELTLWLGLEILLGDAGGVIQLIGSAAANLGTLKFDRDEEREADLYAVEQSAAAGFDPRALGEFLGRMEEHPIPSFLTTHPDPGERKRTNEEAAAALPGAGQGGPAEAVKPWPAIAQFQGNCL
jgi:predicted Zn-dependent protease